MYISGQIRNAIPNTNYSVKIMACTGGGCTESTDGVIVFTNQEGNYHKNEVQGLNNDTCTIFRFYKSFPLILLFSHR